MGMHDIPRGHDDLVACLSHVARSTRAGHSLEAGIAMAVHAHPCVELVNVRALLTTGRNLAEACTKCADDIDAKRRRTERDTDALVVYRSLGVAATVGVDVPAQIDALVEALAERAHQRLDKSVQAATASSSIRLLTWLPLVCGMWMLSDSSDVRHFIASTALGRTCAISGILLNVFGRMWMRRVIATC
jgi:Flp pilus assembly protein TadB